MKQLARQQQGFVLITALLIMVVLVLIAISAGMVVSTNAITANNSALQKQAYQAALSGTESLLAKVNFSITEFDVLKTKLCSSAFDEQYTSSDSISGTLSSGRRQINVYWYACTAVKNGSVVSPADCPSGSECLSVIVSGVACPAGVSEISAKNCTVVRHLQGIANIND